MFLNYFKERSTYRIQLIIHLIGMLVFMTIRLNQGNTTNLGLTVICLIINLLGLIQAFKQLPPLANKIISWLLLLAQPFIIQMVLLTPLTVLPALKGVTLFLILPMAYNAIALLPTIYQLALPNLTSTKSKIILLLFWFGFYPGTSSNLKLYLTEENLLFHFLTTSHLFAAILLTGLTILMMRTWSLSWPEWPSQSKWQVSTLVIMIMVTGYLLVFNTFSDGQTWQDKLFSFSYQPLHLKWEYLFRAIKAGLSEEVLFRYFILVCLLNHFSRSGRLKRAIFLSISLSSLIFGLVHSTNLLTGQDLPNTSMQILYATAIGFLFAVLYLYTGKLSLAIIYHALIDVLAFSVRDSQMITGQVGQSQFIYLTYGGLIMLLFTIYMLTGRRLLTIEANARYLTLQENRNDIKSGADT